MMFTTTSDCLCFDDR